MEQEQSVVRLILLRQRSEYLIAKITELDEEPIYLLERCYEVSEEGELIPFPKHSSQRDIFLTSDVVLTILEPSQTLLDKYNA
jgi:hypothetical protein